MLAKLKGLISKVKTGISKIPTPRQVLDYVLSTRLVILTIRIVKAIHSVYRFTMNVLKWILKKAVIVGVVLFLAYQGLMMMVPGPSTHQVRKNLPKFGTLPSNPVLNPVISIFSKDEFGEERFHCTAFVIDANYAATAGHCVVDKDYRLFREPLSAKSNEYEEHFPVEAVGAELRTDIGLIKGDFRNFKILRINTLNANYIVQGGKRDYTACGHPQGQKALSCTPFLLMHQHLFHLTGPGLLIPGMSGGPVIDVLTNEVVGINSQVTEGDKGYVEMSPTLGFIGCFGLD